MTIDHIALYTGDLEVMKMFFITYFDAQVNEPYHNPRTGLRTYFLSFDNGTRLEIMQRPDCGPVSIATKPSWTHSPSFFTWVSTSR